jgi:hypothetical protein
MSKKNKEIVLPGNPFWKVFKSFGADEAIALLVNFAATAVLTLFLNSHYGTAIIAFLGIGTALLLSVIGPVAEKIGFFFRHFYEAWDEYRTTPQEEKRPLCAYFAKAVKGGSKSLFEDILIHDPLYIAFMYAGLKIFSGIPPWILCVFSFVVAVFAVACLEVGFKEALHWLNKQNLKRKGFEIEPYFESRFYYKSEEKAMSVFKTLVEKYGLGITEKDGSVRENETAKINYYDRYFTESPGLNGRKLQIRARERDINQKEKINSWQLIYLLVSEVWNREVDQYRYFVVKKEKIYFLCEDNEMPWRPADIKNSKIRKTIQRKMSSGKFADIRFVREVAQHPDSLLISFDCVKGKIFIVEIKAYPKRKKLLKEAMRYAMMQGGIQTTHGKYNLMSGRLK